MQQQIDLIGFKFEPIQYSNPKTSKLQIITFMLQIRTSRLLFEPIGFTFETICSRFKIRKFWTLSWAALAKTSLYTRTLAAFLLLCSGVCLDGRVNDDQVTVYWDCVYSWIISLYQLVSGQRTIDKIYDVITLIGQNLHKWSNQRQYFKIWGLSTLQ